MPVLLYPIPARYEVTGVEIPNRVFLGGLPYDVGLSSVCVSVSVSVSVWTSSKYYQRVCAKIIDTL